MQQRYESTGTTNDSASGSGLMAQRDLFGEIYRAQRETPRDAQRSAPLPGHSAEAPEGPRARAAVQALQGELFEHDFNELLDIFFERAPAWPHVSTDLAAHGAWRVPREQAAGAMEFRSIQHNPGRLLGAIALDLDYAEAPARVQDLAGRRLLPAPHIITANPTHHGAHAVWLLAHPVARSEHASQKPLRWLAALEAELAERTDADKAYSGFLTKHPRFIGFSTQPGGARALYTLRGLEEALGGSVPRLNTHRALIEKGAPTGRNVYLFDTLRRRAYAMRRQWFGREGLPGAFEHYSQQVYAAALSINAGQIGGQWSCGELSEPEARATAKSVAKWTWANMTGREFSKIQAERGRRARNQHEARAALSARQMDEVAALLNMGAR